jgi:hypothetical protein
MILKIFTILKIFLKQIFSMFCCGDKSFNRKLYFFFGNKIEMNISVQIENPTTHVKCYMHCMKRLVIILRFKHLIEIRHFTYFTIGTMGTSAIYMYLMENLELFLRWTVLLKASLTDFSGSLIPYEELS